VKQGVVYAQETGKNVGVGERWQVMDLVHHQQRAMPAELGPVRI
jgi:hypothetical protein